MEWIWIIGRFVLAGVFVLLVIFFAPLRRWFQAKRYRRGREEISEKKKVERPRGVSDLRWGNSWLPESSATQHFLTIGTTGSGKTQIQKLLMQDPLKRIQVGSDSRALIFDAKQDTGAFLRHIGVTCPVFSLNPFEESSDLVNAVAWDIAKDITSPARAQNLAASLIPHPKGGGNNQYFIDAARQVVIGVIESLMRHSAGEWSFSDLVFGCLSQSRIEELLRRDSAGQEVLAGFFGDDRTAYQVFTTVCSRMNYYRPVAALWQRAEAKLSIREWLHQDSILLLGANAIAKTSLDSINEQVFRVMTEEVDMQPNSSKRRTWVWIDEARLAGPLLRGELLPYLAVKGRSRGVCLTLAFQDIEGLREAAGERLANELVAQMSNKAYLRMESDGSASFASKQLGQFESIEYFTADNSGLTQSVSGQRVLKDSVLPSEFLQIPPTNPKNGLTGYFVSPGRAPYRGTVSPGDVQPVVVSEEKERILCLKLRPETDQWIRQWTRKDRERLSLETENTLSEPQTLASRRKKLRVRRGREQRIEDLRMPEVGA